MSEPTVQQCQCVVLFAKHDHVICHGSAQDGGTPPLAIDAGNAFD